jgi:hypothetical protein
VTDINQISQAFNPLNGSNASSVLIAATAGPQTVALPANTDGSNNTGSQFAVDNAGAAGVYVFVAFGSTAALAAASISTGATPGSYPCPPGKSVITVPGYSKFVGVIASAAGPTNVYITPGAGKL